MARVPAGRVNSIVAFSAASKYCSIGGVDNAIIQAEIGETMDQPKDDSKTDTISRSPEKGDRSNNGDGSGDGAEAANKSGTDWSTLGTLTLLTIAGGLLIVLYVAMVNLLTAQRKQSDAVENAAVLAARELSQITVQHASFGEVGLCDLPRSRARSIDGVYETLRIDADIADDLKQKLMQSLVDKDLETAKKLEQELAQKLALAVKPDTAQVADSKAAPGSEENEDQDNSVYRHVYRLISSDREAQSSSSVELSMQLGKAKSPIISRDCDIRLIDPAEFVAVDDKHAPYLVLIKTTYEKRSKNKGTAKVVKQACALIAAPTIAAPPAAFMINFPQGIPPQFRSAADILKYKNWTNKGDWQQAVGSEVPGKGSLAPPLETSMATMSPSDAMAVALYHWLKSAGTTVDPDRAVALINSQWQLSTLAKVNAERKEDVLDITTEQGLGSINSCLARDTGAREYSIMNQTGPESVGQTALCRAFSVVDQSGQSLNQSAFPQSALPLVVDQNGNCNLSGRIGFDHDLVQDFLRCVHDTNIAAIASTAMAKQFTTQTGTALSQSQQKVFIEQQELASVSSRLARLLDDAKKQQPALPTTKQQPAALSTPSSNEPDATPSEDPQRIISLSNERIDALKSSIKSDELEQRRYLEILKLANHATTNANRAATATFELCTHAFKLCQGIRRLDSPPHSFLIGNKYIFIANTVPLQESDFLKATASIGSTAQPGTTSDGTSPQSYDNATPWFGTNLATIVSAETAFGGTIDKVTVGGKPLSQVLKEPLVNSPFPFGIVILDSRTLGKSASGQPASQGYSEYPFANVAIPPGESLYYCENAIKTGNQPEVAWSVLLRDLVASYSPGTATGAPAYGSPISSPEHDWCSVHEGGPCPGLACELQIRCPLPILNDLTEDSYLKNPSTNGQIPQIPPVPPDML